MRRRPEQVSPKELSESSRILGDVCPSNAQATFIWARKRGLWTTEASSGLELPRWRPGENSEKPLVALTPAPLGFFWKTASRNSAAPRPQTSAAANRNWGRPIGAQRCEVLKVVPKFVVEQREQRRHTTKKRPSKNTGTRDREVLHATRGAHAGKKQSHPKERRGGGARRNQVGRCRTRFAGRTRPGHQYDNEVGQGVLAVRWAKRRSRRKAV